MLEIRMGREFRRGGDRMAWHLCRTYVGPPGGYVLRFSNGLTLYLSGDTGVTAEQDVVVRRSLGAKLVVMNIGGIFSTGPQEAAFVINELVQPNAVIISHANEAATKDGVVQPGTKTETFQKAVKVPSYPSLSGRTMEFDKDGKCAKGCGLSRRFARRRGRTWFDKASDR